MVTLGKSFLIKIYTENIQRTGHRKLKKQCNVREQKDYICESIFSLNFYNIVNIIKIEGKKIHT